MYELKRSLVEESSSSVTSAENSHGRPSLSVSSMNYFLDGNGISFPENVDISWRPPQAIADQLIDIYFEAVHTTFPIVGKAVFLDQYRCLYSNPNVRPGRRWLAVMNMVFAIAARHSCLAKDYSQQNHDEHHVYFSRAWHLSFSNIAVQLDHPNLQQVQIEVLASIYLLFIGQINRFVCLCCRCCSKSFGLAFQLTLIFKGMESGWSRDAIGCSNGIESPY